MEKHRFPLVPVRIKRDGWITSIYPISCLHRMGEWKDWYKSNYQAIRSEFATNTGNGCIGCGVPIAAMLGHSVYIFKDVQLQDFPTDIPLKQCLAVPQREPNTLDVMLVSKDPIYWIDYGSIRGVVSLAHKRVPYKYCATKVLPLPQTRTPNGEVNCLDPAYSTPEKFIQQRFMRVPLVNRRLKIIRAIYEIHKHRGYYIRKWLPRQRYDKVYKALVWSSPSKYDMGLDDGFREHRIYNHIDIIHSCRCGKYRDLYIRWLLEEYNIELGVKELCYLELSQRKYCGRKNIRKKVLWT